MLAEAIIAMRSVGAVRNWRNTSKSFFRRQYPVCFCSIFAERVRRRASQPVQLYEGRHRRHGQSKFHKNAVQNATGSKDGGLGGVAFNASVDKGRRLRKSNHRRHSNREHLICRNYESGEKASNALMSYLGYTALTEILPQAQPSVAGTPSLSGEDFFPQVWKIPSFIQVMPPIYRQTNMLIMSRTYQSPIVQAAPFRDPR